MNNNGLTLGQLIKRLEALEPDTSIRFDFCDFAPSGHHSYRGYYEDMAIGLRPNTPEVKALDYLNELKSCLGTTMEGYKGGTYLITEKTGLWVSGSSKECTGTTITNVRDLGYGYAILETRYED